MCSDKQTNSKFVKMSKRCHVTVFSLYWSCAELGNLHKWPMHFKSFGKLSLPQYVVYVQAEKQEGNVEE